MRRREFIAGLGGAAAWPVVARAQQPAMPVIGSLNVANPRSSPQNQAFEQRLRELGYVDGQNIAFDYRNAEGETFWDIKRCSAYVRVWCIAD